jgi:hypothetical protein
MAGFTPRITHQADSLELVQDMITAGLGVGLLPAGQATSPRVRLIPLDGPQVELRAYAVARHGHLSWPPLALMIRLLRRASRAVIAGADHVNTGLLWMELALSVHRPRLAPPLGPRWEPSRRMRPRSSHSGTRW